MAIHEILFTFYSDCVFFNNIFIIIKLLTVIDSPCYCVIIFLCSIMTNYNLNLTTTYSQSVCTILIHVNTFMFYLDCVVV